MSYVFTLILAPFFHFGTDLVFSIAMTKRDMPQSLVIECTKCFNVMFNVSVLMKVCGSSLTTLTQYLTFNLVLFNRDLQNLNRLSLHLWCSQQMFLNVYMLPLIFWPHTGRASDFHFEYLYVTLVSALFNHVINTVYISLFSDGATLLKTTRLITAN